jgi:hypothetical protein
MRSADVRVGQELAATAPRGGEDVLVDRKKKGLIRGPKDGPVVADHLRIRRLFSELVPEAEERSLNVLRRHAPDLGGTRAEPRVDGAAQLTTDDEVDHDRRDHDRERDGGRRNERQARAKAHASRRA